MMTLEMFIKECRFMSVAARKLGVSRQSLDRWRRGEYKPSRHIVKLAKRKGVNLEWSVVVPDLAPPIPVEEPPLCEPPSTPTPSA